MGCDPACHPNSPNFGYKNSIPVRIPHMTESVVNFLPGTLVAKLQGQVSHRIAVTGRAWRISQEKCSAAILKSWLIQNSD